MARVIHRLSDRRAKTAAPGMYCDGGSLYLQVRACRAKRSDKTARADTARSWIFRYFAPQGDRQMGLGSVDTVSLAEARERAAEARRLRERGIDPLEAKRAQQAQAALAQARLMAFDECAAAYIAAHRPGWRNVKPMYQWNATLATYVSPLLGQLPVSAIDVGLVIKVLEPIWTTKPETATRVRGRIQAVLDWARSRSSRQDANPARWKGAARQAFTEPIEGAGHKTSRRPDLR